MSSPISRMSFPLPTASLHLYGDQLDPAEISKILLVEPSRGQRMGETFRFASGREKRAKTGSWVLYAEDVERSHEIAESVAGILGRIDYSKSLLEIRGVTTGYIALALRVGEQPDAGVLPPELVCRIARLGLGLSFETYAD